MRTAKQLKLYFLEACENVEVNENYMGETCEAMEDYIQNTYDLTNTEMEVIQTNWEDWLSEWENKGKGVCGYCLDTGCDNCKPSGNKSKQGR